MAAGAAHPPTRSRPLLEQIEEEATLRANRTALGEARFASVRAEGRALTLAQAIEKEIVVAGDLTSEQVERLGEIAHRCPVNQTLLRGVRITQSVRAVRL